MLKKILYLDQNIISELAISKEKERDDFFSILLKELQNAIFAEKIVCPHSTHHIWESGLSGKQEYEMLYLGLSWELSHGVKFCYFPEIQMRQIQKSVDKYCGKDQTQHYDFPWQDAFCSNPHSYLAGHVYVHMPVPKLMDLLGKGKEQYAQKMQNAHEKWIKESASFEESLAIEKREYADMIIQYALNEQPSFTGKWLFDTRTRAILELRRRFTSIQRMLAKHIPEASENLDIVIDFLYSEYFFSTPYLHICASIDAGLASEMRKRRSKVARRAKPSDYLDKQIISYYLPYCDAMFIDRAFQLLISDVLGFDQKYSVRLFSMKTGKEEFLQFIKNQGD